jgi:hypothetical protein
VSKYTLQIRGEPLEDAVIAIDALDGIKAPSASSWARDPHDVLNVTVDAPILDAAVSRVREALPAHGDYTVARPEPLEDEDDEPGFL